VRSTKEGSTSRADGMPAYGREAGW